MKTTFNIGTLALCSCLFLASCGNSEQPKSDSTDHSSHATEATATETPAPAAEPESAASATSNTIVVESNSGSKGFAFPFDYLSADSIPFIFYLPILLHA